MRSKDCLLAITGMSGNFKCEDSRHGKVVAPESVVLTEMEVLNMNKKQKQSTVLQQHEDTHHIIIPSQACENNKPLPGRKSHTCDPIPNEYFNSTENLCCEAQQPNNQQVQEELKKANIETKAMDLAEQERMLKMWNQMRDEQRKAESGGARNPPGSHSGNYSSVDPPGNQYPSSGIYQNLPLISDPNPPDRAYALPPQDIISPFRINSQVQFSDPPRYGVIRWMGKLPQISGLIAGVELVSSFTGNHCTQYFFMCVHVHACRRKT